MPFTAEWSPSTPNFEDQQEDVEVRSPLFYFSQYITNEDFEKMSTMTNMYALQKGDTNFKPTCKDEIQKFFALHIAMGSLGFPRARLYWDTALGVKMFYETMPRNRFFAIRSNIHVVNNLERPENCKDVMYKVRPLYDSFRKRCLQLHVEESVCVDEQMVPFKGTLSVKQYMQSKPCKWGIKIFVLCGESGMCYDFLIYQGSSTEIDPECMKQFGLGAAIVISLSNRLEGGHYLYFDNFFSTYNLFEYLKDKNICAAGTVRLNRFANPPLLTDKDMAKNGRGCNDEVCSADQKVVLVKWFDNKSVVIGSNFLGVGKKDQVERWDKKGKQYLKVERPEVIKLYNKSMGGVDKLDQLVSYYRIMIKSRKWTLRMLFHVVDLAVVNSWLEYRRDAETAGIPKARVLDLLHFRMRLSDSLLTVGKPVVSSKRGRPSGSPASQPSTKSSKAHVESRPYKEQRMDMVDHFPEYDEKKEATRCKRSGCKGKTHVFCIKCKVHLCFVKGKNCFHEFHKKD